MHYRNKELKQRLKKLEEYHLNTGNIVLIVMLTSEGHITLTGKGVFPNSTYIYKDIEDMMNKFDYYNHGTSLSPELQTALEQANVKTIIIDDMTYNYQET